MNNNFFGLDDQMVMWIVLALLVGVMLYQMSGGFGGIEEGFNKAALTSRWGKYRKIKGLHGFSPREGKEDFTSGFAQEALIKIPEFSVPEIKLEKKTANPNSKWYVLEFKFKFDITKNGMVGGADPLPPPESIPTNVSVSGSRNTISWEPYQKNILDLIKHSFKNALIKTIQTKKCYNIDTNTLINQCPDFVNYIYINFKDEFNKNINDSIVSSKADLSRGLRSELLGRNTGQIYSDIQEKFNNLEKRDINSLISIIDNFFSRLDNHSGLYDIITKLALPPGTSLAKRSIGASVNPVPTGEVMFNENDSIKEVITKFALRLEKKVMPPGSNKTIPYDGTNITKLIKEDKVLSENINKNINIIPGVNFKYDGTYGYLFIDIKKNRDYGNRATFRVNRKITSAISDLIKIRNWITVRTHTIQFFSPNDRKSYLYIKV